MLRNPFTVMERWLEWLDSPEGRLHSPEGRLHRRENKGLENDSDMAGLIPTPPGRAIFTVGDLRRLVEMGKSIAIKYPPAK